MALETRNSVVPQIFNLRVTTETGFALYRHDRLHRKIILYRALENAKGKVLGLKLALREQGLKAKQF